MQNVQTYAQEMMVLQPEGEERRLVGAIADGDRSALEQLHARYGRSLFRYLCQMTRDRGLAEEILQDTLLAVWQSARAFAGRSTVRLWLFGVARRQAHNSLRRRKLLETDSETIEEMPDDQASPEDLALASEASGALAAAVRRLPLNHREVLALIFVEGLSYRETATLLAVPEGTVKSRLNHARHALRAALDGEENRA